ncbi:adenylate/guanylate cyclase domain-containing protein [Geomonas sp. Red32]|uniref:CHASE2 domain-containing protein n=1 Tax=Geomonas sp. Red32 TaxID=2912856 RepID=UPI00202D087F|nr:adenylate/guanylate cyclase domain-containing protein [Geomonas sp. Red32]MCM0083523.1 adenylate/guanylate cyclase domain-containing protein [Geomonas sp. Red32]
MKKALIFVAIALAAALATLSLYRAKFPFVEQVDLRLKDARFRVRGAVKPPPDIAVVAIDNKSVKEIGRWPWSREITARLLSRLQEAGAKVVALDMVFSEPQGVPQDRALAQAVASSPSLVLGYFFRNEKQQPDPRAVEQTASSKIKFLKLDPGVTSVPLTEFTDIEPNIAEIGAGARSFGFFNQVPDDDGLFRKAPLLLLYDGDIYPSLGLTALSRYLEKEPIVEVGSFGVRSVSLGDLPLPVNEQGRLSLNYYGPGGTFPTFSASDVINGKVSGHELKDKLIFVGATETGIYDMRATPYDPALPGVEIHCTVAGNTIEKRFLIRDGRTIGLEMGCMFLLPLILALLLNTTPRTLVGLLYFSLCSGFYFVLNYVLFRRFSLDLSVIFPVAPVVLTYIGAEAYRNLVIEKKGRYLKKAFGSYVSPELVEEIVRDPGRLKLGGEKREVSILFSDIRGFTTLSESLTPEALVRLLNQYLSPMTQIVMEERGTLDKFIGDAVMAIYNAPLDVEGHAGHACRSALKMVDRLKVLNEEFAKQGLPRIEIGIGINTGDAVVGNMGADIRFDYTAIGDNVNLASRLEGLNKLYGTHILVSETTRAQSGEGYHFREVDRVRVKGKHEPVAVYELLAGEPEFAANYSRALTLYRGEHFSEAMAIFAELAAAKEDRVSALYEERCREYIATPPATGWDGVYVAKTK